MTELTNQQITDLYRQVNSLDTSLLIELIDDRARYSNVVRISNYSFDHFYDETREALERFLREYKRLCEYSKHNLLQSVSNRYIYSESGFYEKKIEDIFLKLERVFDNDITLDYNSIAVGYTLIKQKDEKFYREKDKIRSLSDICCDTVIRFKDEISAIVKGHPYSTKYTLAIIETIAPVIAQQYKGLDAFLIVAALTVMCRIGIDKYIDGKLRDISDYNNE